MRLIFFFFLSNVVMIWSNTNCSETSCANEVIGFANVRALLKPLEALKQGPIQIECRESVTGGRGGGTRVVRFTLSLKPENPDNLGQHEILMSNAEKGSRSNSGELNLEAIHPDIFINSYGQVMFVGTPFERIRFGATYQGKPLSTAVTRRKPKTWYYDMEIAQDIYSKLMFFNFQSKIPYAQSKERVIEDDTYLCEPVIATTSRL